MPSMVISAVALLRLLLFCGCGWLSSCIVVSHGCVGVVVVIGCCGCDVVSRSCDVVVAVVLSFPAVVSSFPVVVAVVVSCSCG